jgi:beta-galactosidase
LKIIDKLSIPIYGTCITTPEITDKTSTVVVETEMTNSYNDRKTPILITEIMDKDNRIVASAKASAIIEANGKCVFHQEIVVNNPNLWSTESPYLYKAVSKVYNETVQTDNYETSFGIRNITMTPDRGLLLNGKKVLAVGGNMHHDLGCIGAVALERGYERRLQLLKDMGCNSIRLCHNPHAPVLLDLCDKMGILVFDEAFDLWYSQFYGGVISFMEGCAGDIERFVKRDRNHPSVYIWSVGNEVENQYGYFDKKYETQADNPDFGVTRLNYLKSLVKKYDPTRKVTAALLPSRNTGRYFEWEHWDDYETFMKSTAIPMAFYSDVVSWNYTENFFDADHKNYPQMMFIASETATNIRFGKRKNSWFEVDTSYLIGYYYWSASDYLGGSQWPTKTWARAFYDISDEQTALGYLYQSFYSKKPMVRIMVYEQDTAIVNRWDRQYQNKRWSWYPMAEHWNWDKYKTVTLSTFTNCEEVELLINGKTQGKKLLKDYKDSVITWNVQYQNGSVIAIGRNKGKVVSEHELITANAPVKLVLEADRPAIKADGYDLSYIKVKVVDENGVVVPNKDYLVEFDVKGPGYNTGVCNGDIYSDELYQSNKRTTYQGKCLLVVRNDREKGKIIVTAKSNGLQPAECVIKAE